MSQSTVNSDATNQTDVPVEEVDLLVVGGGTAGQTPRAPRAAGGAGGPPGRRYRPDPDLPQTR